MWSDRDAAGRRKKERAPSSVHVSTIVDLML